MLDAARMLSGCADAAELLDVAMRELSETGSALKFECSLLVLCDGEQRVVDWRGDAADCDAATLQRGRPLPAMLQRALRGTLQGSSERLFVPLRGKSGLLGVLVSTRTWRGAFDARQMQCVDAFAEIVATAFETLRTREHAVHVAAEQERARLSRDLHDSVSQSLFGVSLGVRTGLEMISAADGARQPIAYALDLADVAFTQMRALIFEMRADCLHEEGILRGLRRQCAAIVARYKTEFGSELNIRLCETEPQMPPMLREAMYHIAVEAMQNAGKHARANEIVVDLGADDEEIKLTIRDNGCGFDPQATYHGHLGLKSMRERAELAGATLHFESTPGCGTTIVVRCQKK